MKLNELPTEIRNAVLQSAMRVMSESASMTDMLMKADELLSHDFALKSEQYLLSEKGVKNLNSRIKQAQWAVDFKKTFTDFWTKTGYPTKYWDNTLSSELSNWLDEFESENWTNTDPVTAANSNISYWEN